MTPRSFRGRFGRVIRAGAVAAAFSAPGAALAHSGGPAPSAERGLPIAAISHGEMAIINHHLDEIVALAKVQAATDGPVRRLTNHFGLQFAYCGWGLAPGAVAREDSPFNPCAHAYLAAAKELLLAMEHAPDSRRRASAILERIAARRAASPDAGGICSSSGNMFNTAAIVRPKIADVVRDPVTATAGVGLVLLFASGAVAAAAFGRRVVDQDEGRLDVL